VTDARTCSTCEHYIHATEGRPGGRVLRVVEDCLLIATTDARKQMDEVGVARIKRAVKERRGCPKWAEDTAAKADEATEGS
jgi:hypothetical protein